MARERAAPLFVFMQGSRGAEDNPSPRAFACTPAADHTHGRQGPHADLRGRESKTSAQRLLGRYFFVFLTLFPEQTCVSRSYLPNLFRLHTPPSSPSTKNLTSPEFHNFNYLIF